MKRMLLIGSILASLTLVGCQRDVPAVAATDAAAPAPETNLAPAAAQDSAVDFKGSGFAGTYTGMLPCADCPGIDETLVLKPDGSFTLTDAYRDRPTGTRTVAGSWTSEDGDARIRLDPTGKDEAVRFLAIGPDGALDLLDRDGHAPTGPRQQLTRSP
jgi:copper homeostasis protein (lipoprotein)